MIREGGRGVKHEHIHDDGALYGIRACDVKARPNSGRISRVLPLCSSTHACEHMYNGIISYFEVGRGREVLECTRGWR